MKLMIIVDDYSGGAGKNAQLLALKAQESGNQVTLVLARKASKPRYDLSLIKCLEIIPGTPATQKNIVQSVLAIRKLVKSEKPDLVLTFIHNINIMTGLGMIGIATPLIASERTDPVNKELELFWRILRIPAYHRVDKITVFFDYFASYANGRYRSKCMTIPNHIVKPNISRETKSISNDQTCTFISIARLSQFKRFDLMIRLFDRIHAKHPNTRLVIYGEGKERERLTQLIQSLGLTKSVQLPGHTDQIYDALDQADVYLMTSKHEGFPNALVEAMSMGLPSISIKCHEGLEELVEHGINGYLISESDETSFIAAADELINDPQKYTLMSEQARQIASKYSFDEIYKKWAQLFQSVLNK